MLSSSRLWIIVLVFGLCLYVPGLWTIPALDRDEARFAQATKQMLETGDYANIRFQDENRDKKPVGAYWAQVAVIKSLGISEPYPIWGFRIASVLAAIASILLIFTWARHEWNLTAATIATGGMMSALCLVLEAHQAKTDALLLFSITLSQLALYRVWINHHNKLQQSLVAQALFWVGLGLGILIKGPVAPAVVGLTVLWLLVQARKPALIKHLNPLLGVAILAAILAPWIIMKGDDFMRFLLTSWSEDIAPKITSGHESHGAPPLYYLLLMPFFFWPLSSVIIPTVWPILKEVRHPSHLKQWYIQSHRSVQFLVAWCVPAWLLFELAPTKLPHYTLPTYPAIALFCAYHIAILRTVNWQGALAVFSSRFGAFIAALLGGLGIFASTWLHAPIALASYLALAAGLYLASLLWRLPENIPAMLEHHPDAPRYGISLMLSLVILYGLTFHAVLPSLHPALLSHTIAKHIRHVTPSLPSEHITSVGYMEPSLVFDLGTKLSARRTDQVAPWLTTRSEAILIVNEEQREALQKDPTFAPFKAQAQLIDTLSGFNYSRGKHTSVSIYHFKK